jgi:hypothetical protein
MPAFKPQPLLRLQSDNARFHTRITQHGLFKVTPVAGG